MKVHVKTDPKNIQLIIQYVCYLCDVFLHFAAAVFSFCIHFSMKIAVNKTQKCEAGNDD